ncbi:MAG TPA: hypothetical protein VMV45_16250 [Casimicrobiaceae bacterium]|nr:hypothetical protein [Casimicrobiaceae bacterium]
MLAAALVVLACAALLGFALLTFALRRKHVPKGVALLHGAFAATGIVLLIIDWIVAPRAPRGTTLLFIIAAIGGAVVFAKDLKEGSAPLALASVHGLLAIIAFALLLGFFLTQ